jgi:hypothetical protein
MGSDCSRCRFPTITAVARCLKCASRYCKDCVDKGEEELSQFVWRQLQCLVDDETYLLPPEMWERVHEEVLDMEISAIVRWCRPLRLNSCWLCTKDPRLQVYFHHDDDDSSSSSCWSACFESVSTTSTPMGQ